MSDAKLNIVVMISGFGSNLQAIIDAVANGLAANIIAVISDQPDAYGLQRAQTARIPTQIIDRKNFTDKHAFNTKLKQTLQKLNPDLIVLAGYMRIIAPDIVTAFSGKMLNIHPALLPKYPGLNTHARVLAAGDPEHGVTIHLVDNVVDGGPIIAQEKIKVMKNDTAETLEARIHDIEHKLYPKVIDLIAKGEIKLSPMGVKKIKV